MKRISRLGIVCMTLGIGFVLLMGTDALGQPGKTNKNTALVRFPLERSFYLVGETIPVSFATNDPVTMTLAPTDKTSEPIQVYKGPARMLKLDTSRMESGTYKVLLNSQPQDQTLTLVPPWRKSAAAIVNEQVWPVRKETISQLKSSGVNAVFVMGNARGYSKPNPLTDNLLGVQTALFVNPSTRPTSFEPPRVWDWEVNNYLMRLSLISQSQLRYPAFGGICFEWDPGSVIRRPSIFFRYGKQTDEYHEYQRRSNKAVEQQFRKATGLTPPTTSELLQYVVAIGHPEYGPAIDLPTTRWLEKIAKHMKPLAKEKVADLEQRVVAWHKHLMQVYGSGHKVFQNHLDRIDPSLAHTASVNLDHGPVSKGQYAPGGYQNLDFRHMSAWNDQIGIGDYDFQWLLSAALMNARNPQAQPIWVVGATGVAHGMPGKCVRAVAHNLVQNGTGTGSAAEGGYSWLSQYHKGEKHRAAIDGASEFLHRFSSLATHAKGDHQVAILYSQTNFAHRVVSESLGSPAWQALVTLTRLGYTPKFVTEAEIAQGKLHDFKVLTVWNQTFDLPKKVRAAIGQFVRKGGRVVGDGSTTIDLPGMKKMKASIYNIEARGVYGWSGPSQLMKPRGMAQISEFLHHSLVPHVLQALGDDARAWYHQTRGPKSDVTLCQIDPGPDARYVLAINDSWYSGHWSHARWHEVKEKLMPSKHIPKRATLYDLNEEKLIGPADKAFECDLSRVTARVFGIVDRPIKTIDLRARQAVTAGDSMALSARFLDAKGKPLRATFPVHLTIERPDSSKAFEGYRSSGPDGQFRFVYPVGTNALRGEWHVRLRCQLNGQNVSLPVRVKAGREHSHAQPVQTKVVARQTEAIQRLLQSKPKIVIPIFPSEEAQTHLRAAKRAQRSLKELGVHVRIWQNPNVRQYTLTYVPTKDQIAENQVIDQGQAIGKIARLTHRGEDYYTDIGGYRCGVHLLLFDLSTREGDNPMGERLAQKGILWPQSTDYLPGKGKAVVQLVHNAFDPKKSAIVVQANDAEGLVQGAASLVDLPTDWVGTSVSRARLALLKQWRIHGGPNQQTLKGKLTSERRKVQHAPEPFRLNLAGIEVPSARDEPTAPANFKRTHLDLPMMTKDVAKKVVAQQRVRGGFIDAYAGHNRSGNPDLRFSDATVVPVNVSKAGEYKIEVLGVFRYSDRMPRTQGSWEGILKLYKETVPRKRRPIEWEVQLDGRSVGKLKACETDTKAVPIETLPFYMRKKPKSIREEVVTKLCGTVRLPEGKHGVRLIYRNMIDGRLVGLSIQPNKD